MGPMGLSFSSSLLSSMGVAIGQLCVGYLSIFSDIYIYTYIYTIYIYIYIYIYTIYIYIYIYIYTYIYSVR